jgi:hypothetical protein
MNDLFSTEVRTLLSIASGDQIEARDPRNNHWKGTVEVVDPDNGVLWIYTVDGERKLIDLWEHKISKLSAP